MLLSAHPDGLVVGEIQQEMDIPNSTLSHHLDKLKAEDLVHVERESTFLHYTANTEALQELLQFLYAECCGAVAMSLSTIIVAANAQLLRRLKLQRAVL